ncbi:MAG: hypothetical protein LBJ59_09850 [Zoogloeaceae bacterium]|nr:hypothetical protein [Zoogloeaceae bacterium]
MVEGKLISSKRSKLYIKAVCIILAVFSVYAFYMTRLDAFIYATLFFVIVVILLFLNFGKLADEVYDCGDSLLVKMGGKSEEVSLANIQKIDSAKGANHIVISLTEPGKFGSKFVFFTPDLHKPSVLGLFQKHPLAEDLMRRAKSASSRAREGNGTMKTLFCPCAPKTTFERVGRNALHHSADHFSGAMRRILQETQNEPYGC